MNDISILHKNVHEPEIYLLKQWFLEKKRDFPWRHQINPYKVWVSEVMLQQTQASVVVPYFLHWMVRFPTLEDLAAAELDEVIKAWEGLGYYSRARHLHAGARQIVEKFSGIFPSQEEKLKTIKGLGPYTRGAILSFAFHQRISAVDGNVLRVLCRYFALQEDISKAKSVEKVRQIAQNLLPEEEPWIINEALIELGATICTKKPQCRQCPLRKSCSSYLQGIVDQVPYSSRKNQYERLFRAVAVIRCKDHFLVQRVEKGKLMSDLHEFPYFETDKKGWSTKKLKKTIEGKWSLKVNLWKTLPQISHSFTRYLVKLSPFYFIAEKTIDVEKHQWKPLYDLKHLAFSSGHRRLKELLDLE